MNWNTNSIKKNNNNDDTINAVIKGKIKRGFRRNKNIITATDKTKINNKILRYFQEFFQRPKSSNSSSSTKHQEQ